MTEIRVTPERLRQVAALLEAQRAEAEEILGAMIRAVNDLAGEWTGLAQIDYAHLFNEQVPLMQTRLRELLENLSSEMRRIADTFEAADRNVI